MLRSQGPLSQDLLQKQKLLSAMWRVDVTEEQLAWFSHFAGFVPPDVDPRTLPAWPGWLAHRQSLANGDATYQHEDDIGKVRRFGKTVLLFKSRDSSDFLIRIVDILGKEFPHATVHDLPGGHAMHLVGKEEFFNLFLPFLRAGAGSRV